ncbi:MAG: hydrogenase maturation protein [Candidatus Schekmanbacteria bacterium]|nr:hydrogenase maturation protein [Candidatus Schekmanbacteria bacterium]
MRILLLAHAFNSLTQRLYVELTELGHELSVELDVNDEVTREAVELFRPGLIVAPYLRRAIPEAVWRRQICLVVHPGPRGDRGPSALDWAILDGAAEWGVTVLQADAALDAGDVWESVAFPMRLATKSSLYRHEVTEAAVQAVLGAVAKAEAGALGEPLEPSRSRWRPAVQQAQRAIDWARDTTAAVLRKIRSADGSPGVADALFEEPCHLLDAHPEERLVGAPGELIARWDGALCRATVDGAVWIGHVRRRLGPLPFTLPSVHAFAEAAQRLPENPGSYRDLWYEERDGVGFLHFPFRSGAMSTSGCERLLAAFLDARRRPTRVIALMGGPDYWANGIHLCLIEAAAHPADESWRNINAMNELSRALIETDTQLTVAALEGNAGAGGVFLALAADRVLARSAVVLNPHYKAMGNLHGSEHWTYLLPRRCGEARGRQVAAARLPMGTAEALRLGLIDARCAGDGPTFRRWVEQEAVRLAGDPDLPRLLAEKRRRRAADEQHKPLEKYREEELEQMKLNFYGFDPSFHVARYNFVHKVAKSRTPLYLARHRRRDWCPPEG